MVEPAVAEVTDVSGDACEGGKFAAVLIKSGGEVRIHGARSRVSYDYY